jgi:phage FluMu gp28-like protein
VDLTPSTILKGSGRTAANARALAILEKNLPRLEWEAVGFWIGEFYGYQQNWLLDWANFSTLVKARQIGGSFTFAGATVLWGMLGEESTVVSLGERESVEFLGDAKRHAAVLETLGSKWAKGRTTTTELRLGSGGRVTALPSTSGGRGYSGNIVLDEAAYYQRPEAVWDAAAPSTMHEGRMRVLSTPNGVGNLFHRLVTEEGPERGYRAHRVTIEEARAEGLRVDKAKCWQMARGDARLYAQLFQCEFLDSAEQYIPTDKVNAAIRDACELEEGDCYAGLDIGYTNDLTALIVIRQDRFNRCWVQSITTCKRTKWEDQQELVEESYDAFGWKRLCVDSTGMGTVPTELLQTKYGTHRVEGVTFTMQAKEALATGLYQAFNDGMVRIPKDPALINDICAIRRMVTSAGNVRYDATRTDKGHADRAWGLALAIHACTSQPGGSARVEHDPYGGDAEHQ